MRRGGLARFTQAVTSIAAATPGPRPGLDLAAACAVLAEREPALGRIVAQLPPMQLRRCQPGLPGLVWMIIGQQVSIASAGAVCARLEARLGVVDANRLAALPDDGYRACGFSRSKIAYARALAAAVQTGELDFAALATLPDEEAVQALIRVKGVGRWTAETFLMMGEGRTDFFPAADIALQEAVRWLDRLPARPDAAAAAARAEAWRPYRSAAVHILWAWYLAVKAKDLAHPLGSLAEAA